MKVSKMNLFYSSHNKTIIFSFFENLIKVGFQDALYTKFGSYYIKWKSQKVCEKIMYVSACTCLFVWFDNAFFAETEMFM